MQKVISAVGDDIVMSGKKVLGKSRDKRPLIKGKQVHGQKLGTDLMLWTIKSASSSIRRLTHLITYDSSQKKS